jgi:hypothetical protein
MIPNKYKLPYIIGTFGYGSIRKVPVLYNAEVDAYGYNGEGRFEVTKVPMLLSNKFIITGICGFSSIYLWPMWLYSDISRMEAYIRGIPYDYYRTLKKPTNVVDYFCE